jgi:signal transduction protein with GAF and PtsI domain
MTDPSSPGHPADALLAAVARRVAAAERLTPATGAPVLDAVARTAALVLDAQAASIALHDPLTDQLVFRAAAGPQGAAVIGLAIEATAGIAGYAYSTGQPLAIADVAADPRFDRTLAESTGYVPRSLLATPLTDDAGTLGVLEVLDRREGTFTLRDLELAGALAAEAAIVVRAGTLARDTTRLLAGALTSLVGGTGPAGSAADGPSDDHGADLARTLDPATIDQLVAAATEGLAASTEDATWRLAERLARLREVDPDAIDLAVEWLDALLRHGARGDGRRR